MRCHVPLRHASRHEEKAVASQEMPLGIPRWPPPVGVLSDGE
jgi:hypothetical protein